MTTIGQALYEEAQRRILAKFPVKDWRFEGGLEPNVDPSPIDFLVEASEFRVDITVKDGDSIIANVWLEIEDGEVKLHAYDQAHDEPFSLCITEADIEVTNDRS